MQSLKQLLSTAKASKILEHCDICKGTISNSAIINAHEGTHQSPHFYHRKCLTKWLKQRTIVTCPQCLQPMSDSALMSVCAKECELKRIFVHIVRNSTAEELESLLSRYKVGTFYINKTIWRISKYIHRAPNGYFKDPEVIVVLAQRSLLNATEESLLKIAIRINSFIVVDKLVQLGANVDSAKALDMAESANNPSMLKHLVTKHNASMARPNSDPFFYSCVKSRMECLKMNKELGFDFAKYGKRGFQGAVYHNNVQVAQFLLENGVKCAFARGFVGKYTSQNMTNLLTNYQYYTSTYQITLKYVKQGAVYYY